MASFLSFLRFGLVGLPDPWGAIEMKISELEIPWVSVLNILFERAVECFDDDNTSEGMRMVRMIQEKWSIDEIRLEVLERLKFQAKVQESDTEKFT